MCTEAQQPAHSAPWAVSPLSGDTGREYRGPESLPPPWSPRVPHGCRVASAKL